MTEDMLRQYKVLVEFLGKALGPDYEVVLQTIGPEGSGIAAIANGRVSGRGVGSPVTSTALKMIMRRQYTDQDYSLNYTGMLSNGKAIRSSTMFIKDQGRLVGMLCINFDDSRFHELSDSLLRIIHPDDYLQRGLPVSEGTEFFQSDVNTMMQELFDEATASLQVPPDRLNQEERLQIITQLYDRGMFQLKGAVPFVMEKLGCSQASIYRYLSKVKTTEPDPLAELEV